VFAHQRTQIGKRNESVEKKRLERVPTQKTQEREGHEKVDHTNKVKGCNQPQDRRNGPPEHGHRSTDSTRDLERLIESITQIFQNVGRKVIGPRGFGFVECV